MELRKFSCLLWLATLATTIMAVPARRDALLRTAADGTEKTVYLHGNEHFHYMTDEQGKWLDEKTLMPLTEVEKSERLKAKREGELRRASQQTAGIGDKPNIAPRGLIIMVNFKDKEFTTPHDTIDSMMNGANFTRYYNYSYQYAGRTYKGTVNSKGSARKYFQDQSYGQYNPIFDVVGPYTVSGTVETYGKNSGYSDSNVGALIKEACELADANGADFTLYDNDKDGEVDFVYVLYAGEGEADGGGENTIWPHNWKLNYWGKYCTVDGKKINNYACSNEMDHYNGMYTGIGTFVHEFGHVLGLPDFYETNNPQTGLHTLCDWDIMDYGPYSGEGNTPPAYSAYERFYMGWLTPRLLSKPENVTLYPINEDSGSSLMISTTNTHNMSGWEPNPTTYYLLEVRTSDGWDAHLSGPGMLITKVNFNKYNWTNNQVNNNSSSFGMDILEAKTNTSRFSAATDAYPAGATQWTGYADHEVTEITRDATTGAVSFKYRGGTTTQIENIENAEGKANNRKVLRNGQIYILREDGKTYNLLGIQL